MAAAVAERNRLKKWIYQTNDPDLLVRYYDKTADVLNMTEQDCLEKRIASAFAIDSLVNSIEADRDELLIDLAAFGVRRAGGRLELIGVLPDEHESMYDDDPVAAGWRQLFRSRGVEFTIDELHSFSREEYPGFVMEELVTRVLPNTEVVSIRIPSYDSASDEERSYRDRVEYERYRTDMIQQTVRRAVQRWRSPVLLSLGDNIMTVIGMESDALLCLETGFEGADGWLAEIDPEQLLASDASEKSSLSMIYLAERQAAE